VDVSAEQLKVIQEALSDAYAYRTDSGEAALVDLDDYEREACERYKELANSLGLEIQ
jgi:hypothetical protein